MQNILEILNTHQQVIEGLKSAEEQIKKAVIQILKTLQNGGTIFFMGNGGSAADAQHLAAEFIGRFVKERKALPAIALSTDSSILTSISNDYDFSTIFSRQLEALCKANDVVVGISTSGNSPNVLKGIETAKEKGAYTIGLTGNKGIVLQNTADLCIMAPSETTARIQEAHILIGHILCALVEDAI